jgi:hypothetical protein
MTPEIATSGDAPPAGMSEISRIVNVFFEPKKAFADIAARPRWFVPLLLLVIAGFGLSVMFAQKGVMRITVEQQMANSSQAQQLTPEQRQQRIDIGVKVGTIIGYCTPIVIPVIFLVIALVLWVMVSAILSAPVRFGQVFAIVAYAELPSLLKQIMLAILLQVKNVADINIQNPLMFNPGAFMDPLTSSKFVYTVASWFDLFSIWIILLLATGLKAAAGKKLSFGSALFAVVLPWAALVLISAAVAGLFA